jgi:hypothetical protein
VIGSQINSALRLAEENDIATRGAMLVETKLAELEAGIVRPEGVNDQLDGDFGTLYPGYSWQIEAETTENPLVYMLRLDIAYNAREVRRQIANPDATIEFDDPGARIIHTAYKLYPLPAKVNLQEDFGFSEEDIQKALGMLSDAEGIGSLTGDVPDGGQGLVPGGNGGDGGGGGPALPPGLGDLKDLLPPGVDLSEIINMLTNPAGFDPRDLANLLGDDLGPLVEKLQELLGQGDLSSFLAGGGADQLQQMLSGGGRDRGRRGGRGRGDRDGGEGRGDGEGEGEGDGNEGDRGGPPGLRELREEFGSQAVREAMDRLRERSGGSGRMDADQLRQELESGGGSSSGQGAGSGQSPGGGGRDSRTNRPRGPNRQNNQGGGGG